MIACRLDITEAKQSHFLADKKYNGQIRGAIQGMLLYYSMYGNAEKLAEVLRTEMQMDAFYYLNKICGLNKFNTQ